MPSTTPAANPIGAEIASTTTTVTVSTSSSEPTVTSDALTITSQASPPLVCLFRFAGDSAAGGLMGSVFGYVINAGLAGCCIGLALSFPGAPQALLQSCVTFGAFSFIIEGLNKQQPAMARSSFSSRATKHQQDYGILPSLSFPLPNELKDSFSSFYKAIDQASQKVNFRNGPR